MLAVPSPFRSAIFCAPLNVLPVLPDRSITKAMLYWPVPLPPDRLTRPLTASLVLDEASGAVRLTPSVWPVDTIVPLFDVVWLPPPPTVAGDDSDTRNVSFASTPVSPCTLIVIVLADLPGANVTVPDGSTPPTKSTAFAGAPPVLVTAQFTLCVPDRSPSRVTVKVNGVAPT